MKALELTNRADYFRRHLRNFLPHLTVRKFLNLVLNQIEFLLNVANLRSRPVYIKIDPTPRCQLRCGTCAQSDPEFKKQFTQSGDLQLDQLKQIVDPMSPTLLGVSLSLTGEPFMNKSLIDCIEYLHDKGIAVTLPSNFSIHFKEGELERLARSGLDALMVSLDGASAETYSKFREGGDYDLILRNVAKLAAIKKELGINRPRVVWKFIRFEHNSHELAQVEKTYQQLGFDSYEINANAFSDKTLANKAISNAKLVANKQACYWPWHTLVVRWGGEVAPCCRTAKDFGLGNVFSKNVLDIWHGEHYNQLRSGFSNRAYGEGLHEACRLCIGLDKETTQPVRVIDPLRTRRIESN